MPIQSSPLRKANAAGGLAACVDRDRWRRLVTHEYGLQQVGLELPPIAVIQHAFGDQVRDQHRRFGLRGRRAALASTNRLLIRWRVVLTLLMAVVAWRSRHA